MDGKLLLSPFHHRKCHMAVQMGIPMAGEVLAHSHHPALLQTLDHGEAEPAHLSRVIREAAHPNDRVVRIAVDIERRSKVDVHPECSEFGCRNHSRLTGKLFIGGGTQSHRRWDIGTI
ncbi:hypothetical protein SDC9_84588 [bioreactor metagenome]|uniref:Uncharacterized protein n=1 Tax=bioreactor metagenome TaxID=1076179 RepID=A0A644ZAQ0_9ZZZZ